MSNPWNLSDKEKKRRSGLSKEAQDALASYDKWQAENWPKMYPPKTRFEELHEEHQRSLEQYKVPKVRG